MENSKRCIYEILKKILLIQNKKEKEEIGCKKKKLENKCRKNYNTRPIIIYLCQGNILKSMFYDCENNGISSIYRIEKLDDCCATFRILKGDCSKDCECSNSLKSTKNFITVDLSCICALQCLNDIELDCI